MLSTDLGSVDLMERFEGLRVAFPLTSAEGMTALATVWMELAPGGALPEHTDSAEEILFVVDGEVEASVGGEEATLRALEMAVVPALVPHGLRNVSNCPARVLGIFASATNVAVFTDAHGPDQLRVFVIGAPVPPGQPAWPAGDATAPAWSEPSPGAPRHGTNHQRPPVPPRPRKPRARSTVSRLMSASPM